MGVSTGEGEMEGWVRAHLFACTSLWKTSVAPWWR